MCAFTTFLSQIEPKNIKEALKDVDWLAAMQEELHQFEGNKVGVSHKVDEFGNTTRNKARLVVQGYNQEEGIDYDETFSLVARMEAISILIAFASHMEFKLFQMDVKSAFLNGYLKEEFLSSNLLVLKVMSIPSMCSSLPRLYMV
ncbi:uncharacterized mitochondrial protein AtMg00820-like [Lycium barbarum]|uniref:uncharacterized mitochondrial protein AtMg00820-like n=1 Tax=Lycium barbarum TaxID=112863 RepID=UPI00293F7690|nr:uncharacterized mitochondrial protein AtMg00820-like [Lycium barbarum]